MCIYRIFRAVLFCLEFISANQKEKDMLYFKTCFFLSKPRSVLVWLLVWFNNLLNVFLSSLLPEYLTISLPLWSKILESTPCFCYIFFLVFNSLFIESHSHLLFFSTPLSATPHVSANGAWHKATHIALLAGAVVLWLSCLNQDFIESGWPAWVDLTVVLALRCFFGKIISKKSSDKVNLFLCPFSCL